MSENSSEQLRKQAASVESASESHRKAFEAAAWLAAVVENSDDAIITKTLDSIITTWNRGAKRLFGYSAEEAIGQPITILIPQDRLFEEDDILRRLRAGERVDHFETVRRRKNGELVEISVTISPVRDEHGVILGASKIARDITEQKRAAARQTLLFREMSHRIKNLFSLTAGLVSLSARASGDGENLAADLHSRLQALARAHALTMPEGSDPPPGGPATTFIALLDAILAPYQEANSDHITIVGPDTPLTGRALTSVALLLHELATNAAKYGALSVPDGRLAIHLSIDGDRLLMLWQETNAPSLPRGSLREGFGSTLELSLIHI